MEPGVKEDAEATEETGAARKELIVTRVAGLIDLARVGAHLLEAALEGESIDSLPIKQVGELAKAAREE